MPFVAKAEASVHLNSKFSAGALFTHLLSILFHNDGVVIPL